jgi:hypothetical protein
MSYEFLASAVSSCLDHVINFLFSNKFVLAKWSDPEKQGAENKRMKVIVIGVIFIGLVGSS